MSNTALPLFNWLTERGAGVLLHPTALPGDFGIGCFNHEARRFIDFLAAAGFSHWQICPLGPTSFGDSPYQGPSAFAGNPYLIDVEVLAKADLIRPDILGPLLFLPQDTVDFGGIYKIKRPILRQAYEGFHAAGEPDLGYGPFEKFKQHHADWLDAFALFQALKDHFQGAPWTDWPAPQASYAKAARSKLARELEPEIEAHKFYQYIFHGQWSQIRAYARERGISIIGDIPIFVALDSADVWANPALFDFDTKKNQPRAVAGCPPDYFSADGQLWGNPLYDWKALAADGYRWWLDRLRVCFEMCDIVRIDHFRGFDSYWRIPAGAKTARTGKWVRGPGLDFFKAVKEAFPDARIIAEDLGELTPDVLKLRDDTGLPGMAILQFAFGGGSDNLYLPHNHHHNQVLYPGTHDNDTTRGWYATTGENVRDHVRRYFRISGQEIAWDFIRACYESVCNLAIIPLQDLMNLGSEARFNTPGRPVGNWTWRFKAEQLDRLQNESAAYLRELGGLYHRLPGSKAL